MRSIQVIVDDREPGQVQVFATGVDASVASLGGVPQATLWLPFDLARRLRRDLLERLGDTPAVHRIQPNHALVRELACLPWCGGASEPHTPDECYLDHSTVPMSLEPHLLNKHGALGPPTVDVDLEVHDHTTVIGVAVGEDTEHHRILTIGEARQLAAALVDGADLAEMLGD